MRRTQTLHLLTRSTLNRNILCSHEADEAPPMIFLIDTTAQTTKKLHAAGVTTFEKFWSMLVSGRTQQQDEEQQETTVEEPKLVENFDSIIGQISVLQSEKWHLLGPDGLKLAFVLSRTAKDFPLTPTQRRHLLHHVHKRDDAFLNALTKITPTTQRSLGGWCRVVNRLVHELDNAQQSSKNLRQHYARALARALIKIASPPHAAVAITSSECVRCWCAAGVGLICCSSSQIGDDDDHQDGAAAVRSLFQTEHVRDILINVMAPRIGADVDNQDAIQYFLRLISSIVVEPQHSDRVRNIFATRKMHDTIVLVAKAISSTRSAQSLTSALTDLTNFGSRPKRVFGSPEIRDILVSVHKYANMTATGVMLWCIAVCTLAHRSPANQQLLGSSSSSSSSTSKASSCRPDIFDCLIACHRLLLTSADTVRSWCSAVCEVAVLKTNECASFDQTRALFRILHDIHPLIHSAAGVQWWSGAVARLTHEVHHSDARIGGAVCEMKLHSALLNIAHYAEDSHVAVTCWLAAVRSTTSARRFNRRRHDAQNDQTKIQNRTDGNITVVTSDVAAALLDRLIKWSRLVGLDSAARIWTRCLLNCIFLTTTSSAAGTDVLLLLPKIRDAVLIVRSHMTSVDSFLWWGTLISRITRDIPGGADVFRIPEVVSGIAQSIEDVCCSSSSNAITNINPSASSCSNNSDLTEAALRWLLSALTHLTRLPKMDPKHQRVVATCQVRDALIASRRFIFQRGVRSWTCAVSSLTSGSSELQARFATEEMREALLKLLPPCLSSSTRPTSPDNLLSWVLACGNLVSFSKTAQSVFARPQMRDALVRVIDHVSFHTNNENHFSTHMQRELCRWWLSCVHCLSCFDKSKKVFHTSTVRDCFLKIHPCLVATGDQESIRRWLMAVSTIVRDVEPATTKTKGEGGGRGGRALFSSEKVRDALVALRPHIRTSHIALRFSGAVANLTRDCPAVQAMFATAEVRDCLIAVRPLTEEDTMGNVMWRLAVLNISNSSPEAKELFESARHLLG